MNTQQPSSAWLTDLVSLAAIWGSSFLFMYIAVLESGPLPTAAARVAIGTLFLLPIVWWQGLGGHATSTLEKHLLDWNI